MLWMAAFGTWILSLVGGSLLSGLAIRFSRFGGQSEDSWLTVGGQSVDSQCTAGGQSVDSRWTVGGQLVDSRWTVGVHDHDDEAVVE